MITVLAVDHHDAFRASLCAVVDGMDGFALVGDAASTEDALALLERAAPDMVLVDARMSAGPELARRLPEAAIVLLSVDDEPRLEREPSLRGGVAYLRKDLVGRSALRAAWAAWKAGR